MKGLLHSKIFKRNLKKWLCMYVGALLLLTTVVTYSRFISKYNTDDGARITKFEVLVKNIENDNLNCTGEIDNLSCATTSKYRPTTKIPYEFVVTPNFEVNTLLSTTIYVPSDFIIETLEEVGETTTTTLYGVTDNIKDSSISISKIKDKNEEGEDVDTATIITITRNINMPANNADVINVNTPKNYRITIKYNYDEDKYILVDKDKLNELPVIRIGYSAKQIKN